MFAAGLMMAGLAASCASMGDRETERVDGRRTQFVTNGAGAPAVVFEADIGEQFDAWKPVFSEVADQTSVFAYTRPKYDPDNPLFDTGGVRTGEGVASHLRQTLREAGIAPPYVLVGHAVGGLYVLTYAKMYPSEVAGIVLVDGRPPSFTENCRQLQLDRCTVDESFSFLASDTTDIELAGVGATERGAPRAGELGGIPVTLIVATRASRGVSLDRQAMWTREQRRFFDQLVNGRYVEAVGASHRVHEENPYLVIREIRQLVDNVRTSPFAAADANAR